MQYVDVDCKSSLLNQGNLDSDTVIRTYYGPECHARFTQQEPTATPAAASTVESLSVFGPRIRMARNIDDLRSSTMIAHTESEPQALRVFCQRVSSDLIPITRHTTIAETSQTRAERKLNASAAFHRPQTASPLKCQAQILPHGKWWRASTRIPKAANQAKEIRISTRDRVSIFADIDCVMFKARTRPREEAGRKWYQPY